MGRGGSVRLHILASRNINYCLATDERTPTELTVRCVESFRRYSVLTPTNKTAIRNNFDDSFFGIEAKLQRLTLIAPRFNGQSVANPREVLDLTHLNDVFLYVEKDFATVTQELSR